MTLFYTLDDDDRPVPAPDAFTYAQWMAANEHRRQVGLTEIAAGHVSTVFLGVDHSHGRLPPILWETAIFPHEGGVAIIDRYASHAAAVEGHARAVAEIRPTRPPN